MRSLHGSDSSLHRLLAALAAIVCLFPVAADAASTLLPIPALNAIKGPDLQVASPAARPVWMVDVSRDKKGALTWQYAAVDPQATRLATFGHVDKPLTGGQAFAVSWSPDGKRYAFLSVTKADGHQVNIKTVDGGQKVVRVGGSRAAIPWQIAWSPDGRRLAFLAYTRVQGKPTEHSLIIMDTDWALLKNPFVAEYRVPSATLADYPPIKAPPDKLRWSPDGRRILVSWGNVVAIDVRDGALTTIYPEGAAATWTASGDGVLFLAVRRAGKRQWVGIFLQRFDGAAPRQIADAARLSELLLKNPGPNSGILDLSPDGSSLALAGGDGYADYILHVFPVQADGSVNLEDPRHTFFRNTGAIFSLDWSPEGRDLAVVAIASPESGGAQPRTIDVTTTIYTATRDRKQLGALQLPASPEYLDFLGQTRTVSWSR